MENYALAVVPAGWQTENPILFSEAEHDAIRPSFESGMRVLIYEDAPVNAIIAQAQASGFVRTTDWPQANLGDINPNDPEQSYALGLQVQFALHTPNAQVSQARVREVLNDPAFPRPGRQWIFLDREQYDALRSD